MNEKAWKIIIEKFPDMEIDESNKDKDLYWLSGDLWRYVEEHIGLGITGSIRIVQEYFSVMDELYELDDPEIKSLLVNEFFEVLCNHKFARHIAPYLMKEKILTFFTEFVDEQNMIVKKQRPWHFFR